jgi:hypothetical protein
MIIPYFKEIKIHLNEDLDFTRIMPDSPVLRNCRFHNGLSIGFRGNKKTTTAFARSRRILEEACIIQGFKSYPYCNKRMRLNEDVKSKAVDDWAGFWDESG